MIAAEVKAAATQLIVGILAASWLLMLSLGALGVPAGFWPCLGIATAVTSAVLAGSS